MKLLARGARRGRADGAIKGWHVTVKVAHRNALSLRCARAGYCCSIAALLVFFGTKNLQNAIAQGETRTISFHHIHTDEELTVTYKVNGRYDEEALRKINNLMRDWRESKSITMDPHLIDLLWEVHRELGSKEAIWVVCGYRSPETNSMLRRRSSGVAQFSQHMLGKAIDFYIPGVSLEQLREAGLRAQRGGVGFYPTSGAPFVHLDTGSVRHWPRLPGRGKRDPSRAGQGRGNDAQAARHARTAIRQAACDRCRARIAQRKTCSRAVPAVQTRRTDRATGSRGQTGPGVPT